MTVRETGLISGVLSVYCGLVSSQTLANTMNQKQCNATKANRAWSVPTLDRMRMLYNHRR